MTVLECEVNRSCFFEPRVKKHPATCQHFNIENRIRNRQSNIFDKIAYMKKILFTLLSCVSTMIAVHAQTFNWAKAIPVADSNSASIVTKCVVSGIGNVYIAGTFFGNVDFDPGPGQTILNGSIFNGACFIMQLDGSGNFNWARKIEGSNSFIVTDALQVDNQGNAFIAGEFSDVVDFDPGNGVYNITPNGTSNAFILKLNSSGNFVWAKSLESSDYIVPSALKTDAAGNCYVGGLYATDIDLDPGTSVQFSQTSGFYEAFLVKLNSSGTYVNHAVFKTSVTSAITDIDINATGIYLCGNFAGNVDLDPSNANFYVGSNMGSDDFFMVKLNLNNSFSYGQKVGGETYDEVRSIRCDISGNVYLCGNFTNSCDFDPGAGNVILNSINNSMDPFVMKLNTYGDFLWAKQLSSSTDDEASSMDIDAAGNAYLYGRFDSPLDADPGARVQTLNSNGDYDVFVVKLNNAGNYVNATSIGGSMYEEGVSLCLKNNQVYGCGSFYGTCDFDPSAGVTNLTSYSINSADMFVFKWGQCVPSTSTLNVSGCTYTLNGQTYTGNGSYYQVTNNASGCDSIITINLSGSSNTSHVYANVCNTSSYVYNGQTYTASGTYQQQFTNVSGCDSSIYIHLTMGNTTSSTTTASACDYYVFNGQYLASSGTYIDTLTTVSGCDSIITLNLTINFSAYTYVPINACGPVVINGITYSSSTYISQFYSTVNGCDSLVDYDITITPLPVSSANMNSCGPVTINGQVYSTSGQYLIHYQTAAGCDSMVNVNLTITTPNVNVNQNGATLYSAAVPPSTYQWIKCNPYTVITGATSQTYTAPSNGSYAVVVTLNNCKDTSACFTVTNAGVSNTEFANAINIAPNPVSDRLFVNLNHGNDEVNLQVSTATGQRVMILHHLSGSHLSIPVDKLSSGIYFLTVESTRGEKATFKFTKQ